MPLKDKDAQNAYMREWYSRPENRARTIAKVTKRKWTTYAGTCKVCGKVTMGNSGPGSAPEYCGKPHCRSVQRKELFKKNPEYFRGISQKGARTGGKPKPLTLGEFIEREVV